MHSVFDSDFLEKDLLIKKLKEEAYGSEEEDEENDEVEWEVGEGIIEIEIPKSGMLYFSEREVLHNDYLLAAYSHFLLCKFEIVSKYVPPVSDFDSFTFDVKAERNPNFFEDLATTLIVISAGYGYSIDENADDMDPGDFYDSALQLHEDWLNKKIEIDSEILDEYQYLLEEWPLDTSEEE